LKTLAVDTLIDLKLLLPSLDQIRKQRSGLEGSDPHPGVEEILPECLDLFEEMIQIHRHRCGTKRKECVNAFQTLVVSHVHLRTSRTGQGDQHNFDLKLRGSFIRSCKNAHPNESREALRTILSEINDCSQTFLGIGSGQTFNLGSHSFTRFRILIDVAALLILNYSGHDADDARTHHGEYQKTILSDLSFFSSLCLAFFLGWISRWMAYLPSFVDSGF
jgi:hypothetical protein